jgi:pimeloyl-ACP methyl ester carboxylesterase
MILPNTLHDFKNMKKIFLILFAAVLLNGCSSDVEVSPSAKDFYHVEIDGAFIPVLVRGNTSSKKILLYVQGGPGYPSIDWALIDYPEWKNNLEKDYAVAYYDQRGFGNKQGKAGLDKVTFTQYQKDLHRVAQFLRSHYPGTEVILLSHSFGASLSYRYLVNYKDELAVDAYISICGPWTHDGDNVAEARWGFRHDYLVRLCNRFIAADADVEKWQEAKAWAESNDPIQTDAQMLQWNRYVIPAAIETDGGITWKDYVHIGFASPYNVFADLQYELNDEVTSRVIAGEQALSMEEDFGQITLPTLLMAAEFDDQAPLEEIQFINANIGSSHLQFDYFDNAGHTVYLDKPAEFHQSVVQFVESLNN